MTEPATQPTPPQPDPTEEPARDPDAAAAAETAAAATTAEAPSTDATEDPADVADTPEGEAAAEVAATAETGTTAEAIAAADAAADEGATAETAAAIVAAAPTTTTAAETTPVAETQAAEAGPSRRAAAGRVLRQLGVVVVSVGLFVGGIALGSYLFQTTRPAPVGGGTGVVVNSDGPPAVAQEFISALARNDADALRSSLDQEPHLDLTREMTKFGIQRVDNVEVLGTHVDGAMSATEILMQYESTDGTPFAINLVILVDGGKIEGFR
jgi:hypothetical protein